MEFSHQEDGEDYEWLQLQVRGHCECKHSEGLLMVLVRAFHLGGEEGVGTM